MMPADSLLQRRTLRAPREHGDVFVDPPCDAVPAVVAANVQRSGAYTVELLGAALPDVAREARQQLLAQALAYTGRYRDGDHLAQKPDAPLLLAGHQPELFHPGVWFKNFALAELRRRLDAHAVNLLIDNDTVSTAAIRVPAGTVDRPHVELVAYDQQSAATPYEEREILDSTRFASFGERVSETIAPLVDRPLIDELWPLAIRAAGQGHKLGLAVAQARHRLEGAWGARTLELPLSHVCRFAAFRRFAGYLLEHLAAFREVHNRKLQEYRKINRIRSRTHPVPELSRQGDWLEAPFWIWTRERPQRRRAFGRALAGGWEFTDLDVRYRVHVDVHRQGADVIDQLDAYERAGVKLRPRALITTMFARLCLCDLFLHGIGGAKYDQLTDLIITGFFDVAPPDFLTLSATLRLPIERDLVHAADLLDVRRTLRELTFHPERFLAGEQAASELIAAKQRWIATHDATHAKRRHDEITRINRALQPLVAARRTDAEARSVALTERLRAEKLLGSREYAFCLFPEETLRSLLLDK